MRPPTGWVRMWAEALQEVREMLHAYEVAGVEPPELPPGMQAEVLNSGPRWKPKAGML